MAQWLSTYLTNRSRVWVLSEAPTPRDGGGIESYLISYAKFNLNGLM